MSLLCRVLGSLWRPIHPIVTRWRSCTASMSFSRGANQYLNSTCRSAPRKFNFMVWDLSEYVWELYYQFCLNQFCYACMCLRILVESKWNASIHHHLTFAYRKWSLWLQSCWSLNQQNHDIEGIDQDEFYVRLTAECEQTGLELGILSFGWAIVNFESICVLDFCWTWKNIQIVVSKYFARWDQATSTIFRYYWTLLRSKLDSTYPWQTAQSWFSELVAARIL